MLDFLRFSANEKKKYLEVSPEFLVKRSDDLMIKGGNFYAIWDEENGSWSTDEFRAHELIDKELYDYISTNSFNSELAVKAMPIARSSTGSIDKWNKYVTTQMPDYYHSLDEKLIFSNMPVNKKDYSSHRLNYSMNDEPIPAYDHLMSVLYDEEERRKIEWAIGAIISGDSRKIQKFLVFYGSAGTGKSTVINIVQQLFDGYWSPFDAKALGSKNDTFALEPFKDNPLVAIQHDGDLSRIEDNTRLNSIISHEKMMVNEKFSKLYSMKFNSFLLMGTNRPVKITDAKSGILRRLIDVSPSGRKLGRKDYEQTMSQITWELGGIATHCLNVYKEDPSYYDDYIPLSMMGASNDIYNFILDNYDVLSNPDGVTLKIAWTAFKEYAEDANLGYDLPMRVFKEELKNYFDEYHDRMQYEQKNIRNVYIGFKKDKFHSYGENGNNVHDESEAKGWIELKEQHSLFDDEAASFKAQYANGDDKPCYKWSNIKTTLADLDTSKVHYVRVPLNYIVIDFDIKDEDGNKRLDLNLKRANEFPATYAEVSKGGQALHLHYIYDGDVTQLKSMYDTDIEIKVFTGHSSLRRRLSLCNNLPMRTLSGMLPLKGADEKVVNFDGLKNDKALYTLIKNAIERKYMGGHTKPSIDLINKALNDCYNSGVKYNVPDQLRKAIFSFAAGSTHQSEYCLKVVANMKFESINEISEVDSSNEKPIAFFDLEVYPNLFVCCYKTETSKCVSMINPNENPMLLEQLVEAYNLIGFNNRKYDNHILYSALMGCSNEELFRQSTSIINTKTGFISQAYNLSYTDIYDFCSKKQSLKKWEIELGIHHMEMGIPWDKPVPKERWEEVVEYCCNDVMATQAVFEARKGDWIARQILADVADGYVNDTTNTLTTRIIFGKEKHPKLEYTDLSEIFSGYKYESKLESKDKIAHNWYRGEDVGFGGYVYAEPGMYRNVITFDVASMHPSSIITMNCFGEYTRNFKDLLDARIAIKHKDFETARTMLNGKLSKHLNDEAQAKNLAQALKIAINSVYGLTSASFDNPFRDPRNVNNIVALRGALFMVNLKHEVQNRGFTVVHIKTDSIKIENPTKELCDFVLDYGRKYGYNFEIENKFDRICLVNDAVYIAKTAEDDPDEPKSWTATGTQFQVPYVFKKLFSKEPIIFKDLCETKTVTSSLYLDMNEGLMPDEHNYKFVGKAGLFCPIKKGSGGGELLREKDGKYSYATGCKGYRWLESEMVQNLKLESEIDTRYYEKMCEEAIATISEFGDFTMFVS